MLGTGSLREWRTALNDELERIKGWDVKAWAVGATDTAVRGVFAGLSAQELRAIFRGDVPTERPNPRYKAQVKSFILHLRPKYYQRASTWFTHTWRLGWFAVFFLFVETITGLILMIFYAPTPDRAYGDMLHILGNVPFGKLMRDLHRLGAEGMVAVVVLHMLRVYLTGSYKGPRKFTWFTGAILLVVTLFLSFSGYLLPWDQLAYWAVTIGTSMAEAGPLIGEQVNLLLRGAVDIWAGGLLRFYLLHIFLLPLLAFLFVSVHYYKVAREHSISLPAKVEEGDMDPEEKRHAEERLDVLPNLMIHETMLTVVALFVMVAMVATFYSAPLEAHADPQQTPLHTEAPWYFLWLQGMLKLGDKMLFGVVLPTLIFGLVFVVPWLDQNPHRLASKRKGALTIGVGFSIMLLVLSYMGTPGYGIETPPAQNILSHFIPATHPGPVRELPWDAIAVGPDGGKRTYVVSADERLKSDPTYADAVFIDELSVEEQDDWTEILVEFKAEVENAPKLIPPVHADAPLAIAEAQIIQPGMKWITMQIEWDEHVMNLENNTPTDQIPLVVAGLDARTGEPVIDEETGLVMTETIKVQVLDPHTDAPYIFSGKDLCPEDTMNVCPERVYFDENGQVPFTAIIVDGGGRRAQEETVTLDLSDATPNLKRGVQTAHLALHEDSHYEH